MKITKKILEEYIQLRDEKTTLLINIFVKWLYSTIIDIYVSTKTPRQFQEKLFEIPSWSSKTIDKEYKKFLKMTFKKFNLIEDQISNILQEIFVLNIKILSKSDMEIDIPKLTVFWYKLLKYTGKYFYEHPVNLEINERPNIRYISKLVQDTIIKYIPIKDIFNIKKIAKIEYNFDNFDNFDNSNDNGNNDNNNITLNIKKRHTLSENQESDHDSRSDSLRYISSEQFENEYYNPDIKNNRVDDNEEKHIDLRK